MQGIPTTEVTILGLPGLLIGLLFGYILSGMTSLNFNYRVVLGLVISLFGGLITGLVFISPPLNAYITFSVGPFEYLFMILSYLGGYTLGAISNWAPLPEKPRKSHIIYEPDDEDDFDREIEEAMGSDFKANNS